MARYDIIGIGTSALDFFGLCEAWPAPGAKAPLREFSIQSGGLTATACATAARLGARVAFVGKLGDGIPSRLILEGLEADGVDVSMCVRVERPAALKAICLIHAESGERTILWDEPEDGRLAADDVRPEMLDARVLLVDSHDGEAAARVIELRASLAAPPPIVADAESRPASFLPSLPGLDYFIASEGFAQKAHPGQPAQECARRFSAANGRCAIVTQGAAGGAGCDAEGAFRYRAFPAPSLVDTTGCGDVFHGAFAFGLLHGWDARRCATFAAGAAALKCRALGGRQAIPRLNELLEFLAQHDATNAWLSDLNTLS